MATPKLQTARVDWPAEILGILLFCVVGWFIAKAVQIQSSGSTLSNGTVPQPNTAILGGTQYMWPGLYSGSPSVGLSDSATAPGLGTLTIPPLSPVTLPPVSSPFAPAASAFPSATWTGNNLNTAANSCDCVTGT